MIISRDKRWLLIKKRYLTLISTAVTIVAQTAKAQFFTNDFTVAETATNSFDESLESEGAFGVSADPVITVFDPDGTSLTTVRSNLTAGASNYATSTNDTDECSLLSCYAIWGLFKDKSYSIITNTSLTVGNSGTVVSGITGLDGETSYTTVSGASSVFYEIGVE